MNFPFVRSICIPAAPANRAFIFQLIRYSRACGSYHDFGDIGLLIRGKLLNQRFLLVKDDINFPIVNFPFIRINVPTAPANSIVKLV